FILLFLPFVLLGAEYYLLIQPSVPDAVASFPVVAKASTAVLRLGTVLRFGFLFCYTVLCFWLVRTSQSVTTTNRSFGRTTHVLLIMATVVATYYFLTLHSHDSTTVYWLYPASLVAVGFLLPMLITALSISGKLSVERSERRRIDHEHSITIKTRRGYLNVPNPYRGSLVIGSSGSGKSASIGNAFLQQFVQKGFCGIVYDFKFPTLANVVNTALHLYGKNTDLCYYIVNFQDPTLSHRCNPLAPQNIPTVAHAEEYARAIVNNLDNNTIKHREFFSNSAIAWLAALIWFYRCEHPEQCTLPHVINTALYQDYSHVISMLEGNPQSADMVRSIATAIRNKADKQIAGVIASLQIMVTRINSPEIVWVLTGNDFTMNINDPKNPKLLCIGSDPGLVDTFSPVVSLIITVALKQMNQLGKRKSFVLLDEAPTLYIPKFEVIPATARSNKVASVYMAQDIAQMVDMFGKEKAEVIIANLSNQFYGKVSSVQTAKVVSEMIGKEEQMMTNYSQGSSRGSKGNRNLSHNTSTSQQERALIKPQEVMQLQPGEFVGQTVESNLPYFRAQVRETKVRQQYGISSFASLAGSVSMQAAMQENFRQVRKDVKAVVQRYPNLYSSS
ncbi:MAG: type IV secretory system conjugative DNA transfer family protein, partial [Tunicatimonas sp.]